MALQAGVMVRTPNNIDQQAVLHAKFSRLGFGQLIAQRHVSALVRVTHVKTRKRDRDTGLRVERVSLKWTLLRPTMNIGRPDTLWKWWKNELGSEQVSQLVKAHLTVSFEDDYEFMLHPDGSLVRRSVRPLKALM